MFAVESFGENLDARHVLSSTFISCLSRCIYCRRRLDNCGRVLSGSMEVGIKHIVECADSWMEVDKLAADQGTRAMPGIRSQRFRYYR